MTITADIKQIACSSAVAQYQILAKAHAKAVLAVVGVDLDSVLKQEQYRNFGGLWDAFTEGPLTDASAAINEAFGFDPKLASDGKAQLGDAVAGLFKAGTWQTAFQPISDSFSSAVWAYENEGKTPDEYKEVNPYFTKSEVGNACASNQYAATAAAVSSVLAGAVNQTFGKITRSQMTLKSALSSVPNFLDGLFAKAVSTLNSYYDLEVKVLEQMQAVSEDIVELLKELATEDIDNKHDDIIRLARFQLCQARLAFNRVGINFTSGNGFSESNYNAGQDFLAAAGDVVCGTKLLGIKLNILPYKILAKIQLLVALRKAWMQQQYLREKTKSNLISFNGNIDSQLTNIYAPFIDFIRCRIKYLVADMTATLGKNDQLLYLAKEKSWCLGIKTLRETSNVIEKVLGVLSEPITFGLDLSAEFQVFLKNQQSLLVSAQVLDKQMKSFIEQTYAVLIRSNLNINVAIARGKGTIAMLSSRAQELDGQKGIGSEYLSNGAIKTLESIAMVNQFSEYLIGIGLDDVAHSIAQGNLSSLLNLDALSASSAKQALSSLTKLIDCKGLSTDPATADQQASTEKELIAGAEGEAQAGALKELEGDSLQEERNNLNKTQQKAAAVSGANASSTDTVDPSLLDTAATLSTDNVTDNVIAEMLPKDELAALLSGDPAAEESTASASSLGLIDPVTESDLYTYTSKPVWWPSSVDLPTSLTGTVLSAIQLTALRASLTKFNFQLGMVELQKLQGYPPSAKQLADLEVLANLVSAF